MKEVGSVSAYSGPPALRWDPDAHPPTSVPAQRVDGWTRMQLDLSRPAFAAKPESSGDGRRPKELLSDG